MLSSIIPFILHNDTGLSHFQEILTFSDSTNTKFSTCRLASLTTDEVMTIVYLLVSLCKINRMIDGTIQIADKLDWIPKSNG